MRTGCRRSMDSTCKRPSSALGATRLVERVGSKANTGRGAALRGAPEPRSAPEENFGLFEAHSCMLCNQVCAVLRGQCDEAAPRPVTGPLRGQIAPGAPRRVANGH